MPDLPATAIIDQLLAVLHETLEGPAQQWSYFTDTRPNTGLAGTLAPLTAAEASRPVAGTSVAAHVHHAMWAMDATSAWIRGDRNPRNWADSWKVSGVDGAAWTRLRQDLGRRYQDLRQTIETHALSGEEAFGGTLAAIAHLAYHLGAIRQKIAILHTDRVV
jgi:hypothetical protein